MSIEYLRLNLLNEISFRDTCLCILPNIRVNKKKGSFDTSEMIERTQTRTHTLINALEWTKQWVSVSQQQNCLVAFSTNNTEYLMTDTFIHQHMSNEM